jgi:Protein of unknown function (DUF2752)
MGVKPRVSLRARGAREMRAGFLLLHFWKVVDNVLPPLLNPEERAPAPVRRALTWPVRSSLLLVLSGLVMVFSIALWLDPYYSDGEPRSSGTHRQLGLPPCTFKVLTRGKPCPSCGMTTSFALLAHGDVINSLRANWVGTLLASFCLAVIPWGVLCLIRGRLLGIRSLEQAATWAVGIFLVLLLLRWAFVVGPDFWSG